MNLLKLECSSLFPTAQYYLLKHFVAILYVKLINIFLTNFKDETKSNTNLQSFVHSKIIKLNHFKTILSFVYKQIKFLLFAVNISN